ncbi:hypothetical protein [Magnetospirillum sp. 15-1]|uniref:hypothetical protein n=1 Tax=Magnetospirillum sp. 15-1 TaxID=1979370 RepID=UPI000BBC2034|nr:hypothetical protein [Magnetospirillum sp. 15-1]
MANKSRRSDVTTAERAAAYDALEPLLNAMFREFQELSKKKPDGVLNKNKINVVNRLLIDVQKVLDDEPNRSYLDLLNEDDVPQYSDVVITLGQHVAAMAAFHSRYHGRSEFSYGWAIG